MAYLVKKLKIKPEFPHKILREPFYKGVFTGMLICTSLVYLFRINETVGVILLTISLYLYFLQTTKDYNFIG